MKKIEENISKSGIVVAVFDNSFLEDAKELASKINAPITNNKDCLINYELSVVFDSEGVALICDGQILKPSFSESKKRLKPNNLFGETLIKAAKFKNVEHSLTAIDATAGLGEDSFLLAAAGFSVLMFEYNPIIACLLRDCLKRAENDIEIKDIVKRMKLIEDDSVVALTKIDYSPDLVLLDPMFPTRQKSSLVKKKFQLIHHLEKPCENEDSLLHSAMGLKPKKIIIKRPIKAPFLSDIKPSYSISGNVIRYDCIILTNN